jgi:glycosyltransferase involved in cell wall biosynthesis
MTHQPLLPSIGVIALVADPWNVAWRRRHHVLTRLARYFHVIWVNPARDWRDLFRSSRYREPIDTDVTPPAGFTICDSIWLPRLYRPQWLARYICDARIKRARSLLSSRGCRKIILYMCRPEFAPALKSILFDLSCYHIDDEYSFSEVEVSSNPEEIALIATVSQIFIHSVGLMNKKGAINPNTAFIPNGVDFQAYARPVSEPKDLSAIPRPRLGYTGIIKKQLDWRLILKLVRRHPEWSFIFVGPIGPPPEMLPVVHEFASFRNVHFLGYKTLRDLAAYPQHFDVCLMPYRVNAYTNNIYPLKLHEYLASGRPVVGSAIRTLQDFSKVAALPSGVDEWSNALARALEPTATCPDAMAARQNIAREHDWDRLVYKIAQTLCERMGSEYEHRFHEIASRHCDQAHSAQEGDGEMHLQQKQLILKRREIAACSTDG